MVSPVMFVCSSLITWCDQSAHVYKHCIHLVASTLAIAGKECEWNQSCLHVSVLECTKGDSSGYQMRIL